MNRTVKFRIISDRTFRLNLCLSEFSGHLEIIPFNGQYLTCTGHLMQLLRFANFLGTREIYVVVEDVSEPKFTNPKQLS